MRDLQKHKVEETGSQIGEDTYVLGKVKHTQLNTDFETSLAEAGATHTSDELPVFYRIKKRNVIHHSQSHLMQKGVRNSTVCS